MSYAERKLYQIEGEVIELLRLNDHDGVLKLWIAQSLTQLLKGAKLFECWLQLHPSSLR